MKKLTFILLVLLNTFLLTSCGLLGGDALPTAVPTSSAGINSSLVQPTAPPTALSPTAKPGPTLVPTVTTPPISAIVEETNEPEQTQFGFDITAVISTPLTFNIVPEQSSATFFIGEVLLGQDKMVEGKTDQISGALAFTPSNLPAALISPITIDATALETDNGRRNRALRTFILQTGDHPTIIFTPTKLSGLPPGVTPNQATPFTIEGTLKIRDIEQTVTFAASATWVDLNTVQGSAESTILYKEFDLTIPDVPTVASVDDDVRLVIEFTATR